jgi:hypothetical protein
MAGLESPPAVLIGCVQDPKQGMQSRERRAGQQGAGGDSNPPKCQGQLVSSNCHYPTRVPLEPHKIPYSGHPSSTSLPP